MLLYREVVQRALAADLGVHEAIVVLQPLRRGVGPQNLREDIGTGVNATQGSEWQYRRR